MARTNNLTNFLTDVADAIKEKKGDSTAIPAADFDTEIINLPSGGAEDVEDFPIYETWLDTAKQILGISSPYRKLEYIESTGTQYIDTDIPISTVANTGNLKMELKIKIKQTDTRERVFIGSNDDTKIWYLAYNGTNVVYANSNYNWTASLTTAQKTSPFVITSNVANIYADDTLMASNYRTNSIFRFFKAPDSWTRNYLGVYELYYCKIWDNNDVLTHNFIPAKRVSDDGIGLYDIITDTFYTNDGTGDFVAGPEEGELLPYTELEYIESTGTQWIDTDFTPNSDTKIELDFALTSYDNDQGLVSAYDVWAERSYLLFFNQYPCWTYGRSVRLTETRDMNRHTTSLYKGVVIYDGNTVQNITTDTYSNINHPIRLFASWASGHTGKMKLYGFQVYDDGVLTHNFIPVKRKSDNEICLYDQIEGEFYTNDGTGTFVAGPEK